MNKVWAIILIAIPIVAGLLIFYFMYVPQPPPVLPVVISNGCSYYQVYHSRRTQHYEYIHVSNCTNKQHVSYQEAPK